MKITASDITAATGGRLASGPPATPITGVSTDSRTLASGDAFFALVGERFDGHQFLRQAAEAGAAAVVISDGAAAGRLTEFPCAVIIVADTLRALGDLAASYRRTLDCAVVAITGSCGKTSVKEMLGQVLETRFKGHRPESSFNNFVGVPLTIFRSEPGDDYLILELGTNAPGEMRRLAGIAQPTIAVVTCVAPTHLEGLGSLEGVAQEKEELVRVLGEDGLAVLNADDPRVAGMADVAKAPVRTFGATDGDVLAEAIAADARSVSFTLDSTVKVRLPVPGRHNVLNALAAVTVAREMGLDDETIAAALARYRPPKMRLVREELPDGLTLIDDAYNANLASCLAALDVLCLQAATGRYVLVQGDMLELGRQSKAMHEQLGRAIADSCVDLLVTVGAETQATSLEAAAKSGSVRLHFRDSRAAAEEVVSLVGPGDVVLVKGSRGMALEHVVTAIRKHFGGGVAMARPSA
ncbi:MAG: UDP-N-acetylmuramoyl-tripeptide--D-alanyl-D-alanine ligase [Planctomycetes bacterium]|nr:UDP-N-acetylmuramoyl-tripeptide--D-alanyl-D-alanine ligase [Planctomycetota bacterium]